MGFNSITRGIWKSCSRFEKLYSMVPKVSEEVVVAQNSDFFLKTFYFATGFCGASVVVGSAQLKILRLKREYLKAKDLA
ncbi:hypothetical protein MKX03_009861, partial [Papaver bracteatum]